MLLEKTIFILAGLAIIFILIRGWYCDYKEQGLNFGLIIVGGIQGFCIYVVGLCVYAIVLSLFK